MEEMSSQKTSISKSGLVNVMNKMRKEGTLCDVTLVVQGRSFPAHRVVLAAASTFFRLMFTTKMKESQSPEVELKEVEPDIIEQLLEYIYTAKISLDKRNAQLLLYAADQYQIDPVRMMCLEFLKEQIDATNCLGMVALAEFIHSPELKAAAEDFSFSHFTKVIKFSDFLQLDVTRLKKLLCQDKIKVSAEEQIYNAGLSWVKHDVSNRLQYLAEVLGCVRFPLISQVFLSETMYTEPLFQNDPKCLSMLVDWMQYHLLSWKDRRVLAERTRPRQGGQMPCIALFRSAKPHFCRFFNLEHCSWTRISSAFEGRQRAAAVCWDNMIYLLGGSSRTIPTKRVDCYRIQQNSWSSKSGMITPRNDLAACAAQDYIYTTGGSLEDGTVLNLFECFNTKTDSWEVKSNMLISRTCHGSVEVDGLIYVCGGMSNNLSQRIISYCEVYNPTIQKWRPLCPMKKARKNHGLVVVHNRIYAIGGQGPQGFLKSVEYYDTSADTWNTAAPLPYPLMVKCAAVGEKIFVLAGESSDKDLQRILEYNTKTNLWVTSAKVRPFPFKDSLVCAVV